MSDASDEAKAKADAEAKQKELLAKAEELRAAGLKVFSDEDFKKLTEERDKAKEKLRQRDEADKKAEEEKAKAEGKFKELLEQREKELESAKKLAEELAGKATRADELEKTIREQHLTKIADPELRKMAESLATENLVVFAEKITKVVPSSGKAVGVETGGDAKNFQEWEAAMRKSGKAV